jgi:hypothetical protein
MSDETLRWKLFPFSLEGKAKTWYDRTTPRMGIGKLYVLAFA